MNTFSYPIIAILVAFLVCCGGARQIPLAAESHNGNAKNDANSPFVHTIRQRLDNFDIQNEATFQQRYSIEDNYFNGHGPIYLLIANYQVRDNYVDDFLLTSVARREGGIIAVLEPRFFGKQWPTSDLSVENLRFLTIDQTLADIAHFVVHLRATTPGVNATTPIVVSGRGYGGSLAVWFRHRYPHLSAGVWGHAANVLALQSNEPFAHNIASSMRYFAGDECYAVIEEGLRGIEARAVANDLAWLTKNMDLCGPPLRSEMLPALFDSYYRSFIITVRELAIYEDNYPEQMQESCTSILADSKVNGSVQAVVRYLGNGYCINMTYMSLDESVWADEQPKEDPTHFDNRQTMYLRCTQLGSFKTSSPGSLFESQIPLRIFTGLCTRLFGEAVANHRSVQENQDRFNVENGGLTPSITNALFTFGPHDPERSLQVTSDLGETAVSMSTGFDAYYGIDEHLNDPETVVRTEKIIAIVRSWTRT